MPTRSTLCLHSRFLCILCACATSLHVLPLCLGLFLYPLLSCFPLAFLMFEGAQSGALNPDPFSMCLLCLYFCFLRVCVPALSLVSVLSLCLDPLYASFSAFFLSCFSSRFAVFRAPSMLTRSSLCYLCACFLCVFAFFLCLFMCLCCLSLCALPCLGLSCIPLHSHGCVLLVLTVCCLQSALNSDPFNIDAQKQIEEEIRLKVSAHTHTYSTCTHTRTYTHTHTHICACTHTHSCTFTHRPHREIVHLLCLCFVFCALSRLSVAFSRIRNTMHTHTLSFSLCLSPSPPFFCTRTHRTWTAICSMPSSTTPRALRVCACSTSTAKSTKRL